MTEWKWWERVKGEERIEDGLVGELVAKVRDENMRNRLLLRQKRRGSRRGKSPIRIRICDIKGLEQRNIHGS